MNKIRKFNVPRISREICEVLAKHQVPVAMLKRIFQRVEAEVQYQAVIPQKPKDQKKTAPDKRVPRRSEDTQALGAGETIIIKRS